MTPLDLSQRPPRPCRAEIDGIAYLPRAIDKVRASLPGGNLGAYLNVADIPTMSSLFYHRMGITHDEFTAAVASAAGEDDVVAWLRARIPAGAVEKFRSQMVSIRFGGLPEAGRAGVVALYPAAVSADDDTLIVDLIDADDAAMFART